MSLASSDVPKDDAPARKSATSKKDSTKSFPKLVFEEAFARTDGDENLLLRAARVIKEEARASAAQLPARLDGEEEEGDATGRGEEEEHRCWGRSCALMFLTFGEN